MIEPKWLNEILLYMGIGCIVYIIITVFQVVWPIFKNATWPQPDKCRKCGCTDFFEQDIFGPLSPTRRFLFCEDCTACFKEITKKENNEQ